MKYNKFLFKETLLMIIMYIGVVSGIFLMHMLWLKDMPLEKLLLPATLTAAWLMTSYIFFIDMNNNMISRLIINGGTRSGIWLSKFTVIGIAAVFMSAVQTAAIVIENGSFEGCFRTILNVTLITILSAMFLGALTALLSVLIKNMSVVVILIFAYVCPWTYAMAANCCERSKSVIIRSNPFYSLLKMANTCTFSKAGIIGCCLTGLLIWIASFMMIRRKELKENN